MLEVTILSNVYPGNCASTRYNVTSDDTCYTLYVWTREYPADSNRVVISMAIDQSATDGILLACGNEVSHASISYGQSTSNELRYYLLDEPCSDAKLHLKLIKLYLLQEENDVSDTWTVSCDGSYSIAQITIPDFAHRSITCEGITAINDIRWGKRSTDSLHRLINFDGKKPLETHFNELVVYIHYLQNDMKTNLKKIATLQKERDDALADAHAARVAQDELNTRFTAFKISLTKLTTDKETVDCKETGSTTEEELRFE